MEYLAFERRLLRLIFRTNTPLTPVHVAYYVGIPIAEAREHLDRMVAAGILELDSDEYGHIVYTYPMRPPLESLPAPRPPRRRRRRAHAPLVPAAPMSSLPASTSTSSAAVSLSSLVFDDRRYSPAAAAALSLFLPGVGQIYSGRVPQGIGWLLATGLGYLLFLVPGLILHICCIVNAAAVPVNPRGLPALGERHA